MLVTRIWNGRNYQYLIKVHIARHREAFNDFVRGSYKIKYFPLNKTTRVIYLLTSVHTYDPTICSFKTTIQADVVKKYDFESATDFLLITEPAQKHQGHSNHRTSGLISKLRKVKIGPKNGVEVRFHIRHEWKNMSKKGENEVRESRKN